MFTGIVREVGRVAAVRPLEGGVELDVEAARTAPELEIGASVAVNGVCQTVTALRSAVFSVQAVGATLERTTLSRLAEGDRVNIERSLKAGDEIGGHLVMGHVDAVGVVEAVQGEGEAVFLTVRIPAEIRRFAAARGSMAIDGVSLTLAHVRGSDVVISLIPYTLQNTIAGGYEPGDPVNVEVDLLARYLDRLLEERLAGDRRPDASRLENRQGDVRPLTPGRRGEVLKEEKP
jgi:riboflavin synthase